MQKLLILWGDRGYSMSPATALTSSKKHLEARVKEEETLYREPFQIYLNLEEVLKSDSLDRRGHCRDLLQELSSFSYLSTNFLRI